MDEIENQTCIKFRSRKAETEFIEIYSGNGCSSNVGRVLGGQKLSLMRSGCIINGVIQHELMHALGFFHMQSSFDRDNYVRINYNNIASGSERAFDKYSKAQVSYFGTSYDFDSVMHYRRTAFSKNGLNTIETLKPSDMNRIGQRLKLSEGDVSRINNMYCSVK